jgi:demethylmenaquinone methyltransferase / 2-methoxy-6-polyprenyl-1,4-benzoquinol methylase
MTIPATTAPGDRAALPPHPVLPEYYGNEEEHRAFVRRIFDSTAPDYNRIERVLAFGSGPWYRRQALRRAGLRLGDQVADVGIGTGLVAREALKIVGTGGSLTGIDPSAGMMAEVQLPGVQLLQGRAESLPLADGSVDFVSMGYALRHLADVGLAFSEFARVLRPGGRVLVLEISRPRSRWATALLKGYMHAVMPMAAALLGRQQQSAQLWRYYWDTIAACIAPEAVLASLRSAGFDRAGRHVELGIFSEYTAVKAA